ncbi:chaperonin 10-like protein [Penicillium longicatenatum]|nr:chaperonin 10-like protein [Penicillium longicatenatum]
MTTQKAVVVTAPQVAGLVTDRPLPTLRDEYILIKTEAVALNPTDWKHVLYVSPPNALIGCDYAGVVVEVGKDVKKPFKKGDRICGFVHGGNVNQLEDGAFAEYIVAKGDLQMHIPDNLSFQQAATLGVGITTVGQSLYQTLKLALPTEPLKTPEPLLIYGGSTATGALAIQFAKLSGYKSLGADEVFDYKDPNSAAAIRAATDDKLKLVLDTISIESSAQYCGEAMSTTGGDYTALLAIGVKRENVNNHMTLGYTAVGEAFDKFGRFWPAQPENKEFAIGWWKIAEPLLAAGKIKVHTPKVNPGGLRGVLDGLELLKNDKVSGEKLVYNVAETN